MREVREDLRPGNSALFVVAREGNMDAVIAALAPYRGTLRQTTLPTEVEESLRRALE